MRRPPGTADDLRGSSRLPGARKREPWGGRRRRGVVGHGLEVATIRRAKEPVGISGQGSSPTAKMALEASTWSVLPRATLGRGRWRRGRWRRAAERRRGPWRGPRPAPERAVKGGATVGDESRVHQQGRGPALSAVPPRHRRRPDLHPARVDRRTRGRRAGRPAGPRPQPEGRLSSHWAVLRHRPFSLPSTVSVPPAVTALRIHSARIGSSCHASSPTRTMLLQRARCWIWP